MTDKVQKIKDWISKEQDGLMDAQGNFENPEHEGAYHILCNLDTYIDSLQGEPVSEELIDVAKQYVKEHVIGIDKFTFSIATDMFISGAKWQKEQIEEVLLSEVLPCFMHGGEADEVVAKLDEVLNQKK